MTVTILEGDCRAVLKTLASGSIHTCVTSPPYFNLRDYGHDEQIGTEDTPTAFVAHLVQVFREVRRVLRDDGTLWLNIGDTYASSKKLPGLKPKDLIGLPWMVAFALRADGWYLRQDNIWNKTNAMPDTATDRPGSAHEHVFLLTKHRHYYYDNVAVKHAEPYILNRNSLKSEDPNASNLRSVWSIPTSSAGKGEHFATFPAKLAARCIKAGTSQHGCCPACGAPWVRVTEEVSAEKKWGKSIRADAPGAVVSPTSIFRTGIQRTRATVGWKESCTCAAADDVVPCVVLDCFGGYGTTAVVAERLQRDSIYVELKPEYVAKARLRIYNDAPMFAQFSEDQHG